MLPNQPPRSVSLPSLRGQILHQAVGQLVCVIQRLRNNRREIENTPPPLLLLLFFLAVCVRLPLLEEQQLLNEKILHTLHWLHTWPPSRLIINVDWAKSFVNAGDSNENKWFTWSTLKPKETGRREGMLCVCALTVEDFRLVSFERKQKLCQLFLLLLFIIKRTPSGCAAAAGVIGLKDFGWALGKTDVHDFQLICNSKLPTVSVHPPYWSNMLKECN